MHLSLGSLCGVCCVSPNTSALSISPQPSFLHVFPDQSTGIDLPFKQQSRSNFPSFQQLFRRRSVGWSKAKMAKEASCSSSWTREQEKAFENALATHPEDCSDWWEKVAADVPGKSIEDVKSHYELLLEDVNGIESGQVPLPCYPSSLDGGDHASDDGGDKKGAHSHGDPSHSAKASRSDQERRKGIAWTEDEHRLFLLGLDKYGKGDWRSISRNFVVSRTPTQVASHAQKYFIRLNSMNKERRRTSIHDITSVVGNGDVSTQVLITGQTNGPVATSGMSIDQSSQPLGGPPGVGVYGTTIGQPVGGPLISAVGTPVNLPVPGAPHIPYGER